MSDYKTLPTLLWYQNFGLWFHDNHLKISFSWERVKTFQKKIKSGFNWFRIRIRIIMRHLHWQLNHCQRVKTDYKVRINTRKISSVTYIYEELSCFSLWTKGFSQIEIRIRINMSDPYFKIQNMPICHGKNSLNHDQSINRSILSRLTDTVYTLDRRLPINSSDFLKVVKTNMLTFLDTKMKLY